jgi:septal ring factor EnvC (AmiA/AmiB activator)
MQNSISIKLPYLILAGIIFLVLLYLAFISNTPTPQVDKYETQKKEIDSLTSVIKTLNTEQEVLSERVKYQEHALDSIKIELTSTEKELNKTRKYYGDKIKNLNSSSPSELNDFFSDRYK